MPPIHSLLEHHLHVGWLATAATPTRAATIVVGLPHLLCPTQAACITERLGTMWTLASTKVRCLSYSANVECSHLPPFRRVCPATCHTYMLLYAMHLLRLNTNSR